MRCGHWRDGDGDGECSLSLTPLPSPPVPPVAVFRFVGGGGRLISHCIIQPSPPLPPTFFASLTPPERYQLSINSLF